MSDCPPIEVVDDVVSGRLDDERVRCHVERCGTCQPIADRMRRENVLLKELTRFGLGRPEEQAAGGPIQVAGFQILEQIQRGGQGAVYKAIQQSTRRTVALKVLLGGPFASSSQRRRFEREIEVVGRLRHPNIVTLYDSGVADGRYYFAMEYVDGERLDEFVARQAMNVRATLRLFAKVCAGVNHAHEVGVIHRDLKPGNVFVDKSGEPRVLDFGLARPAEAAIDSPIVTTQANAFLGTFAYAAPEQIRGERNRVDTRSDVYSLGVILHQILTQSDSALREGGLIDARRVVTGHATEKPSAMRRRIDGDVDAIVMRCLEDDPAKRYQTAGSLQRDIEHYLAGEPVNARRSEHSYTWYVVRKWFWRRRWDVAAGGAIIVLLVSFVVSLIAGRQGARGESAGAAEASLRGDSSGDDWAGAYAELEHVLASAAGDEARDLDTALMAHVLRRGVERANGVTDPVAQARLRISMGRGLMAIREYTQARTLLEQAWQAVESRPPGDALARDALDALTKCCEAMGDGELASRYGGLLQARKLEASQGGAAP